MGVYTANMRYEVYGTRRGMFGSLRLPFVKCSIFSVSLQRAFFNNKPHFLEKWGRWGRRLALQQNINGPSHCCAKLTSFADWGFTAFWVLAVNKAVYKSTLPLGLKKLPKITWNQYTLIIVVSVITSGFEAYTTIGSFPPFVTMTFPLSAEISFATSVTGTASRAAF